MKAVVMAGGEGARLRPLTSRMPKPLVPVLGTPVLEHILRLLREHGITEVVVTLAYLGAEIRNRLGDGADLDMHIEYVVEDRPLGTAGSVRNAAHLLDDTFLVISGDALTDIDLTAVMKSHKDRGSHATIVLHSVPNPLEYGVVVTDDEGNIKRFLEKPSWGEVFSDHANTGIYVIEPQVLDHIKQDFGGGLVAGRLPDDVAAPRTAARHRGRRLLDGYRLDPVVPAGQLGRARRQGAVPHPRTSRGQRLDGGGC